MPLDPILEHSIAMRATLPGPSSHDRLILVSTRNLNRETRFKRAAALMSILAIGGGCAMSLPRFDADRWLGDFDAAERRVAESEKELFFLYLDGRRGRESHRPPELDLEALASVVGGKVRCVLSRSYEPDRRYVAQYGVDRAPAVILVHRDGTYHARTGPMTADDIHAFLASVKPPGATVAYNPHIPRRAHYKWQNALDPALAQAAREGKPLLIVYHRKLSLDWRRLKKLLHRHEVCSRLDDTIHCRIALLGFSRESAITPFGTLRLPALVIVGTDGQHNILETPTSYEAVARFAELALTAEVERTSTPERTSTFRGVEATKP